ncbi:hypothetical protein ABFS82_14G196100 [Erythranthe guttata]|uniref:methyl-CpG-binding domain-containing protein 4-like isoform X1 n=1 Tax=Erythranthe guttata TaxID=4155 RepID=UPI00064E0DD8|nr:PREDICTED: methyl-CpG-binding domain-containing protein 4-like isoform X1 [Erythranthe guttata]|eukprot:XP_012836618.1 PREDICTED: methyl-CpG-binding domain-containing protein 4-like isoform X1 [Erythranthe guttata]
MKKIITEKTTPQQPKMQPEIGGKKCVEIWSAQCGECFKWRIIPSEDEYEEIRSKFIEDPFVCSKKAGVCCNDGADIEYDKSRTWVIDKPNTPKTPAGFKRRMVMRGCESRIDCYYKTPNGKKQLRSPTDVSNFLTSYPEYNINGHISLQHFSFNAPKIMQDTLPPTSAAAAPKD